MGKGRKCPGEKKGKCHLKKVDTRQANTYLSLMKALIQVSVERNGNAFYLEAVLFEYIMTISSYLSPEMFYQMFC